MAVKTDPKAVYRSPSRSDELRVSLDEFTDEEIAAEAVHRGITDPIADMADDADPDIVTVRGEDLQRILTLQLCGQSVHARELLFRVFFDQTAVRL